MTSKEWYNNKELFEKITEVQKEFNQLSHEMTQTRQVIKKYNGLYEKVNKVDRELRELLAKQRGQNLFGAKIREWGGWLFGLITLIIMLINHFS